jgi:hypothetical protein
MTETVLLAIIAVAGTALGAALSPIVDLISKTVAARTDDKSERIRAVAEFSQELRTLASRTTDTWDSSVVRRAHEEAVAHRFAVARTIPKGAGRVDWFCEYAVEQVAAYGDAPRRLAAADHSASLLLAWARGDRKPSSLHEFHVEPDGNGGYFVP